MTPRCRTVDDGESKEEEVESENLAHCSSFQELSNQASSDLLGLSFRRIDIHVLQSMMSSMHPDTKFLFGVCNLIQSQMYIELGVVGIVVNFYAMTRGIV